MVRKIAVVASGAALLAVGPAGEAWAQVSKAFSTNGTLGVFLNQLSDRLDHTIQHIPKLGRYLLGLPEQFDLRITLLLIGIVAGGLAAEFLARQLLQRLRRRSFSRHSTESPLRAFLHGALLDAIALVALVVAARYIAA
ncbi:MAG TPA: hypothetical protein VJQ81_01460, partial [Reyranella sp.]|nr:hypothetical protein [Reyranella sp.]